jgi:hypothetical protein
MIDTNAFTISDEIIIQVGLTPISEQINAVMAPYSRVFAYPGLDKVYIMESDLYGNTMNEGRCFLAFYGQHGLIGKELTIETLQCSSQAEIKRLVDINIQG